MISLIKNKIIKTTKANSGIVLNVLGAFSVKGASALMQLFLMPAYMRYFDNQILLGLWFTVINLLSLVSYFDLGIGNGLRNHLTIALTQNDEINARKYISSAYIISAILTIVICLLSIFVFRLINWNVVFNVSTEIISESLLSKAVIIIITGLFTSIFLRLILSIFYAIQFSMGANIIVFFQNSLLLLYLIIAKPGNMETNIIVLAFMNVFCMNFPLLAATVMVFARKLKRMRPHIRFFDKSCANKTMQLGGLFFLIQIMTLAIMYTDDFFISFFTSPEYVVEYQIYCKLFTIGTTLFILALSPVWSAVTKAIAQNNFSWLRKMNKFIMLLALSGMVLEFVLMPFLQVICDFWLKNNSIKINYQYAFIFAIFGSLIIWNSSLMTITSGMGVVKTQLITLSLSVILKITLILIFSQIWNAWIVIVAATTIALIPNAFALPILINRYLNKTDQLK
jgi:O-antigen/teichoic acid export membrane protein